MPSHRLGVTDQAETSQKPGAQAPHAMKTDVADLAKLGLGLCGAVVVARILWKLKSGAQGALPETKKDGIEKSLYLG